MTALAFGCMRPTPTDQLLIFFRIMAAELCQLKVELFLSDSETLDLNHLLQVIYQLASRNAMILLSD